MILNPYKYYINVYNKIVRDQCLYVKEEAMMVVFISNRTQNLELKLGFLSIFFCAHQPRKWLYRFGFGSLMFYGKFYLFFSVNCNQIGG